MDMGGLINQGTTGLSKGWLGQPVDDSMLTQMLASPGVTTAWLGTDSNGIFKREYDNGWVGVNSSRTTDITIPVVVGANEAAGELESGKWRRFQGYQNPTVDDGSTITSDLTIPAIGGVCLVRV